MFEFYVTGHQTPQQQACSRVPVLPRGVAQLWDSGLGPVRKKGLLKGSDDRRPGPIQMLAMTHLGDQQPVTLSIQVCFRWLVHLQKSSSIVLVVGPLCTRMLMAFMRDIVLIGCPQAWSLWSHVPGDAPS
jgi:hypothetical protein